MNVSHSPDAFSVDEPVRLLIIGAGKMGEAHAAAFQSLNGVELVGIVSRGGESAERLAAKYGVPHRGTNWRSVADEARPHACVVAVSHLLNEQITAEVIEHGLHTLAEKPVSLDAAKIRALAAVAQANGVIAMAAMNRRFYPPVTAALEMVRCHGPVTGVTVIAPDPVRPHRATHKYDPSVYDHWTQMNTVHAIDLLRLIGGEIDTLCGRIQRDQASDERSIAATIQFRSGALGSLISYGSHGGQWELRIHGDGVEARLVPLEQGTVRIGNAAPIPLPKSESRNGLKPGLLQQARAFLESIGELGHVAPPGSDFYDHACTMAFVEQLMDLPEVTSAVCEHGTAGKR